MDRIYDDLSLFFGKFGFTRRVIEGLTGLLLQQLLFLRKSTDLITTSALQIA